MTLDDETAGRIADEVWSKRGKRHTVAGEEYVRAGYAARDAEVEELRATLATADRQFTRLKESSGKADAALVDARATLAKVREWAEQCFRNPRDGVDGRTDWEYLLSSILDESPTERETPADREDVARVLRDADRPDVPAHLPPSRSYARMAAALMERFTITDGAHSSSVSITSPEVTTSDAVSGETPADEWEYAVGGRNSDGRVWCDGDEVTPDIDEAREWVEEALESGTFANACLVRRRKQVWEVVSDDRA